MEVMGWRRGLGATLVAVAVPTLSSCGSSSPTRTADSDVAVNKVRSIGFYGTAVHSRRGQGYGEPPSSPFVKAAHSLTDPQSQWVVVNKLHPVSPTLYRPTEMSVVRGYQVASMASTPLSRLLRASDEAGLGFKIASAFRSYRYQASVHATVVAEQGAAYADHVSARAGYSEHQTGLAVDLITPRHPDCDFRRCFGATVAGQWLRNHATRYGFLMRYTHRNEHLTGYRPEPWHIRYVGRPLAREMARHHVDSLEKFFGVSGGSRYRSP
jgi:zinc D-Ala-D-Ala carboxypeptidase